VSPPRRSPADRILDLTLYAPIGAVFHGPAMLDELAGRGRAQVRTARVIGRLAVDGARRDLDRRSADIRRLVGDTVVGVARAAGAPLAGPARDDAPPAGRAPRGPSTTAASTPHRHLHAVDSPEPAVVARPDASRLPIPGYDSLSASQVVPRLDDLTADELDAVGDYERATRGRMTILNRIAQLRAS